MNHISFFETLSMVGCVSCVLFGNFWESTNRAASKALKMNYFGEPEAASKVQVKGRKTFCIKLWWSRFERTTVWATCEVVHFRLGKILNLRDMAPIELSTFEMRLLNVVRLERHCSNRPPPNWLATTWARLAWYQRLPELPGKEVWGSEGFWILLKNATVASFILSLYDPVYILHKNISNPNPI